MKCGKCGETMIPGRLVISGTLGGFLFFGLSYKHLYFEDAEWGRTKVLDNSGIRQAYRCGACGSLFMDGSEFEESGIPDETGLTMEIAEGEDRSKIVT